MKMRNKSLFYQISIIVLLLAITNSCEKDNDHQENLTNGRTSALFNSNVTYGSMTDQDGNVYKTISINGQTWMAENLRTTKYRNGDLIPQLKDNSGWSSASEGAFCNYGNTENIDTIATYGRLYNWYAVSDSRNLAPEGWHVATNSDWLLLSLLLGGDDIAGSKLKEIGVFHWYGPNEDATNESGLTILPTGLRDPSTGTFGMFGYKGLYWSGTQADDSYAWAIQLLGVTSTCNRVPNHMNYGYAIRCVKN